MGRDLAGGAGVVEAEANHESKGAHVFIEDMHFHCFQDFPLYLKWYADKRRQQETQ